MINAISAKNNQRIRISEIPVLTYEDFLELNTGLAQDVSYHCVNYFGWTQDDVVKLYCCMADDSSTYLFLRDQE
jgi:hypothetical protein